MNEMSARRIPTYILLITYPVPPGSPYQMLPCRILSLVLAPNESYRVGPTVDSVPMLRLCLFNESLYFWVV